MTQQKTPALRNTGWSFQQAAAQEGARGGALPWLEIDSRTGIMTNGRDKTEVPKHEFAVLAASLEYGFVVWRGGRIVEEVMVPVNRGPCPTPGGPYAEYPSDGPVALMRFIINSLDEPGLCFRVDAKNASNLSRTRTLIGLIAVQEVAAPEFVNPIIRLHPAAHYPNRFDGNKPLYCLNLQPIDWMSSDGMTRWSSVAQLEDVPWDDSSAA